MSRSERSLGGARASFGQKGERLKGLKFCFERLGARSLPVIKIATEWPRVAIRAGFRFNSSVADRQLRLFAHAKPLLERMGTGCVCDDRNSRRGFVCGAIRKPAGAAQLL